jgi:hypothetical protein
MLLIPSIMQVGDVTVYADDVDFHRFYAIASAPRLRTDADGDPVFLLLSYALSDEERAAHPDLPAGGGYMAFDMTFELTEQQFTAVQTALQPRVDADWNRLRAGTAADVARANAAGADAPPKVVLANPTWTEGAVTMNAPQSDRLVDARVAEATPSLLTGNIASFSLDLTPAGAQFMEEALLAEPGVAADEAPIQVAYDLRFWARLPPARIHLAVDAEKMHSYVQEQFRGRNVNACSAHQYETTVVDTEALTLSGAVTCQIDTGSGSLPDEVIAELRGYAFDLLKQIVQHSFFNSEGDDPGAPAPAAASGGGRTPIPPLSARLIGRRRLVRKDIDTEKMSIRLDLEQSSVVPWSIHPRGTLQTLLGDDNDARRRHVRKLRLNDPFFATLAVDVHMFTDFAAIDHAEVELAYAATDESGAPHAVGTVLVFTETQPQTWSTPVVGGVRSYRWRMRAVLAGGRAQPFGPWTTTNALRLPLSIESPGSIAVDVISGSVDFEQLVRGVQVRLAYEDAASGIPREEASVLLSRERQSASYLRRIDAPRAAQVLARTRFDLINGDVIDNTQWEPVPGNQFVVNQPSEALLAVRLLPAGNGWDDVVSVLVDLAYEDAASGVSISETFALKSLAEFATWQVFLRDRSRRSYRHRWIASFANGDLVTRDWTDNPGDPVLPIRIDRPGITVTVVADSLDFATCPLTEVNIRHDVPGGAATTLIFRTPEAQRWHVNAADGAPVAFVSTVTHFPADRDPVVLPERRETDPIIVLPAYRAMSAGELRVQVLGELVDFSATPLIAVDLNYRDVANAIDASQSFTLDPDMRRAEWVLATRDARATEFRRRITYFLADGSSSEGEWKTETMPRVVVPKFRSQP